MELSDHQRKAAKARAAKLSPERRKEIAALGGKAGKGKKKPRKKLADNQSLP